MTMARRVFFRPWIRNKKNMSLSSYALLEAADSQQTNKDSGKRRIKEPEPQIQDPERRRRVEPRVQGDAGVDAESRAIGDAVEDMSQPGQERKGHAQVEPRRHQLRNNN